ncbi:MAG: hypothetical protein F4X75_01740 [Gemmatimonadetes bacterium]|nr:hypothetical protein [Gemmatimonadota bacterium]
MALRPFPENGRFAEQVEQPILTIVTKTIFIPKLPLFQNYLYSKTTFIPKLPLFLVRLRQRKSTSSGALPTGGNVWPGIF